MALRDDITLMVLWVAYCIVHSTLISIKVTNFLKNAWGENYRFYRLFFNLFSVGTLAPLLWFSNSLDKKTEFLFRWEGYLRIPQYGLIGLAAILVAAGARHYSLSQFMGVQQIFQKKSGKAMTASGEFDCRGVLGIVRHPWYLAVFILLWASDLHESGIIINGILSAYLIIGTFLEERKLVLEFGEKYRSYQHQVSMLIPIKWLGSKLQGGRKGKLGSTKQ